MSTEYKVEMIKINKSFGGVHALKDVTFSVKPGEIHALVGENGAGKSTMMKILSGVYREDSGTIKIDGNEVTIHDPSISKELGISIIYQELMLAPHLTVAENIFIDRLSNKMGLVNYNQLFKKAEELIAKIGFDFNPRALVGNLTVAYQQVVEIAKALSKNAKILILDEPTAVLAPSEVEKLLDLLMNLKEKGVSIIYISHRLDEVFRVADRITVLKDGAVVNTFLKDAVKKDDIITEMVGRKLEGLFPSRVSNLGGEILRVENLCNGDKVKNVSFTLRSGEVLGIAGLVGSGRSETVRALFGADKKDRGMIYLDEKRISVSSCRDSVRHRIGFVPENRKEQGVILSMSLRNNMTMTKLKDVTRFLGVINSRKEKDIAQNLIETLKIKAWSPEMNTFNLSGGNQQKVVLAKWFNADCRVMILDEPTRGVDVGAKYEIYNLINELSGKGIGVIMISSEMIEIIGMCDRALVMHDGEVRGELSKDELSEENIMRLAISSNEPVSDYYAATV
ncbi:MAG TPA: sugar ABC transporter ATP-binding protein [Bacillota bacterium]|nr:sugar ABC transporter ATP-binding protein [Bacillota bacterium]